jgi:hypothetical protein
MAILGLIYAALVWLVFVRLRLLPWNWASGSVALVGGVVILAVFLGLLNNLTLSGPIVVVGRVVEVSPNVGGQVTATLLRIPSVFAQKGREGLMRFSAPVRHRAVPHAHVCHLHRQADTLAGGRSEHPRWSPLRKKAGRMCEVGVDISCAAANASIRASFRF